jgi:hypothetical protein
MINKTRGEILTYRYLLVYHSIEPVLRIRIRDPVLFHTPFPGSGSGMNFFRTPDLFDNYYVNKTLLQKA